MNVWISSHRYAISRLILMAMLILTLSMCVACGKSAESSQSEASEITDGEIFQFIVISDLHVRLPGNPDDVNYDAQKNLDNLTYIINRINSDYNNADFVVTTGDLVGCLFSENTADYGTGTDTTAEHYKSMIDTLIMPIYSVLGNHDYQKSYNSGLSEGVSSQDRAAIEAVWKKVLGIDPYYSVLHKGVRLIFANSNRGDHYTDVCYGKNAEAGCTGSFDTEQIAWLRTELANSEPAIIFFHHPPITDNRLIRYFGILSYLVEGSDDLYDVVTENQEKILGIFVGHGHVWAKDEIGQVPVYETGAIGDGNADKDNIHIVEVNAITKEMKVTIGNPGKNYGF